MVMTVLSKRVPGTVRLAGTGQPEALALVVVIAECTTAAAAIAMALETVQANPIRSLPFRQVPASCQVSEGSGVWAPSALWANRTRHADGMGLTGANIV